MSEKKEGAEAQASPMPDTGSLAMDMVKFAQANQHAPNWGRLHLKWGQALVYAWKPEEAKAKFAIATRVHLTPSEKSELPRVQ